VWLAVATRKLSTTRVGNMAVWSLAHVLALVL